MNANGKINKFYAVDKHRENAIASLSLELVAKQMRRQRKSYLEKVFY